MMHFLMTRKSGWTTNMHVGLYVFIEYQVLYENTCIKIDHVFPMSIHISSECYVVATSSSYKRR